MSLLTNEDLDFAYGATAGDTSYDAPPPYSGEGEETTGEPIQSDYETAITDAYSNLAAAVNFGQYVSDDTWGIMYLPKSARHESKSRIRKILPGGKEDKSDGKSSTGKTTNQKGGFLNRFRSGVSTLVKDENNLLFGERSNYDVLMYDEEDEEIDTDDLHRYAQKLRDLEDNDKEINPEYLVLRDGKTVYAVQETDADGKTKLSTRKPIYDRFVDQTPDDEPMEKKKFFSRIKNTFSRNKDKDNKSIASPKSSNGTPDANRKRSTKKSSSKYTDDGMATTANSEPLMN
ncbi:unnamed protein product [Rotaria sp. Silwood2]|nr:unnamed protein product [Rotaria sp. Silwood2]CAF2945332.1 unnamed protein product [Rotaria sp. Silwood2]CAF4049537.1 unnamed protein product [Rotaria sp. Silwood2]CAF4139417.1 unnamed protein product [Rotaria sp. Silwood2]